MDQRRLKRRFFRLTAVNILSNVTIPLAGLVDTAMLGHLPQIRFLAGVALGTIIFEYVYWSFGFLRMGSTGLTAQAVGRGDRGEESLVLYRYLALAALLGALILLLQWPMREGAFLLLAGQPEVEEAGRAYFDARIWGAPAVLCNFALLGWFLGRGEGRRLLAMNAVANLCNALLNYVFIIRFQMAAQGAGFASMASQYLMLGVGLVFLARSELPHRPHWRLILDRRQLSSLFRLNGDILVRTLALVTSFGLFANFSALLGTASLAANSILLRLLNLASFAIDGAAFASESLAGYFLGRRDRQGLARLIRLSLQSSLLLALAFVAGLTLAGRSGLRLLTSHQEIIELAFAYRFALFGVVLAGAAAYAYDGIFLGMSQGRVLRNSMLFSSLGIFLPVAAGALLFESNQLLWAALLGFMLSRAILLWRASVKKTAKLGAVLN